MKYVYNYVNAYCVIMSNIGLCFLTELILLLTSLYVFFFLNGTATTKIYTLSLHDALPIYRRPRSGGRRRHRYRRRGSGRPRSEEHTSELQSRENLVCRLLLEKKKNMFKLSELIIME